MASLTGGADPVHGAWSRRAAALDAIERRELVAGPADPTERTALEAEIAAVAARLRARIAAGVGTPASRRHAAERLLAHGGDDALELLLAALLDAGEPDPERLPREPEMVWYQPTPGRVLLRLAATLRPDDTLYDLGAGLGRVVLLAALWSGCNAIGVEREPVYVEYARRVATSLALDRVRFLEADARDAPLHDATAIFLYTPFRGSILREVAARLPAVPVYAYGPCVDELAAFGWRADPQGDGLARMSPPCAAS